MFSDTEEAQVITLRALFELWRNHQQMMVVLVDKLLKTQIVECAAVATDDINQTQYEEVRFSKFMSKRR